MHLYYIYNNKTNIMMMNPHETQQLANYKDSWKQIYERTQIDLYGNYKVSTVCPR